MTRKSYAMIGAAVGLVGFLAFALLPTLLYGGYAGVLFAGAVVGTPIEATLLSRAAVPVLYYLVARRGRAAALHREGALAREAAVVLRPVATSEPCAEEARPS